MLSVIKCKSTFVIAVTVLLTLACSLIPIFQSAESEQPPVTTQPARYAPTITRSPNSGALPTVSNSEDSVRFYYVSIAESRELTCRQKGFPSGQAPAGKKYVVVGLVLENKSSRLFADTQGWVLALGTQEGFNYSEAKEGVFIDRQFGCWVTRDPGPFGLAVFKSDFLPPGFRIARQFMFEVGEKTHISQLTIGEWMSPKTVATFTQPSGPIPLPFDKTQVTVEKIGSPHKLPSYSSNPKAVIYSRIVTVVSVKKSSSKLMVLLEMKNENIGEEGLFYTVLGVMCDDGALIPPSSCTDAGLSLSNCIATTAYKAVLNVAPAQSKNLSVDFMVNPNAKGLYLILGDLRFKSPSGEEIKETWVVDLS